MTAAEATQDPELWRKARKSRRRLGQDAPFAGFKSGQVAAGLLAAEIFEYARSVPGSDRAPWTLIDLYQRAEPLRMNLASPAQAAFDAAALAVACWLDRGGHPGQEAPGNTPVLFDHLARQWAMHPERLAQIAQVLVLADQIEVLVEAGTTLVRLPEPGPALTGLVKALAAQPKHWTDRLIRKVAAHVSRSVLAELQACAAVSRRVGQSPAPKTPAPAPEDVPLDNAGEAVAELDQLLTPGFSIARLLDKQGRPNGSNDGQGLGEELVLEFDDEEDFVVKLGPAELDDDELDLLPEFEENMEMLAQVVAGMGGDPRRILRMNPLALVALLQELGELARGGSSFNRGGLEALLNRHGLGPGQPARANGVAGGKDRASRRRSRARSRRRR